MSGWNSWGDWNPGPMVTFCFDDSRATDYTRAFTRFRSRGVNGVSCLTPGYINYGASGTLTYSQVAEMYAAGWDVISHSLTHPGSGLSSLSPEQLTRDLRDSQHYLRVFGWDAHSIAYPTGANDAAVRAATALYYRAGRSSGNPLHNRKTVDRYNIASVGLDGLTAGNLATYQEKILAAQRDRGWLSFTHHEIADDAKADLIGQVIDYAQSIGVPVVTFREALDRWGVWPSPNRETANLLLSCDAFGDVNYWIATSVTVAPDQIDGPVGGAADLLVPGDASSILYQAIKLKQSQDYTFSIYLRAQSGTFSLRLYVANPNIFHVLQDCVLNEQWQRFVLPFNTSMGGNLNPTFWLRIGAASSWSVGEPIYAACAMLNEGATALPYVPGIA